ncbi:hypothetical protein [Aquimarina pacifica]|uniref:hypothetical protein n=1 Tax=Aquimarina pacifica TaxID=1296415 RepID=UPI00046E804F|nr:hypothetical protein [Aquimarina pacifica]
MKNQKEFLIELIKNLDGMSKTKAYELTHRIETLLYYASNPLSIENLKTIISSKLITEDEIDPFYFSILPNGNFCEFKGRNSWLHIYKENKKLLHNCYLFDTYYYKTKYAPLELLKLTKKNVLESVKDTDKENDIHEFLSQYRLKKREHGTNKLQLLNI